MPDKSLKSEQKDAATWLVLSSHLQLQKDGFLSAWTNSFVGPWDPSQGLHNPDEKIKLWLFLPGRHSSILESAQDAVSRLRVVASGLWLAPGDSEEVAAALSQALRNSIGRALFRFSYMRFGDVFSRCHLSQSEDSFRKGQPVVEFMFSATDEAIFVHAIISAKHVRSLSSDEVEKVFDRSPDNSSYKFPVIVSPHGMLGRLTGCCPSDLVKQVYFRAANGFVGLPYHLSEGSSSQMRGKNRYVEVTLGCPKYVSDKTFHSNSNNGWSFSKNQAVESAGVCNTEQKGSLDQSVCEKTFIYPAEAVLVPVMQTSFARSSLKRFWMQNWMGPSLAGLSFFMHCVGNVDSMQGSSLEISRIRTHGYNSSSNSNNSSISSITSSSSDSVTAVAGDFEADADSLSCRQSGLTSNDHLEDDHLKMGSKRPRPGMADSFSQAVASQDAYNSGINGVGNDQIGSSCDWDDDDRNMGMDIQSLLSEFGDFGDFFENDALPFGEPPGTAESEALMFPGPDCGDVASSPVGLLDVSSQMLLPVGFPAFESFNPPQVTMEESPGENQLTTSVVTSGPSNHMPAPSTGEFDHLMKTEALMTFALEYGAVETPGSDASSIFRNPYLPKSRSEESSMSSRSSYVYGATPPSTPCAEGIGEKTGILVKPKANYAENKSDCALQLKKHYIHMDSGKAKHERSLLSSNDAIAANVVGTSHFSNYNAANAVKPEEKRGTECKFAAEQVLLSMKTVLATDLECAKFQASMLRLRHIPLSPTSSAAVSLSRFAENSVLNQLPGDTGMDVGSIPVRIAGDIDGGILDGHYNAPIGVWRPAGAPKVSKLPATSTIEVSNSFPHSSFSEEGIRSYGQRQPLIDLLDAMTFLVQQATSFVDVALDSDFGDGPFGWLALQEQWRRGFTCGPSAVHAGCGGTLASCHSLDIAGVELVDPFSYSIHVSSVISMLHSEIKTGLKSAFRSLDGPLFLTDWCKGRSQLGEIGFLSDGSSAESSVSECRESSNAITLSMVEPMSPQTSVGGSSSLKVDGGKFDEASQRRLKHDVSGSESEQQICSRMRPTLLVLPSPAILVGYQDDWLKTSASSLQVWEKAPLEPYALQKNITYSVICPDIDPLTFASADFFQQLGTVYETCQLGTHSPQSFVDQMEIDSGKSSSQGFILLDCPQSMKMESSNSSLLGSISDYFLSLSNGWDLTSYLKSLSKAFKSLKLGPWLSTNQKEGISSPCMVIYVVCPFPEPAAVLQTVVESSVAIGSAIHVSDRDRRSLLQNQVGKALRCSAAVDEASIFNIPVLSGFSVPRLVLQVVTVDAIFRVTSPPSHELVVLKETAFTIYNKARRISRGSPSDMYQSSSFSGRSHPVLHSLTAASGMWKDRIPGSLQRDGDMDSGLRPGAWDNSWQTRTGGLSYDVNRNGDCFPQDEGRYMFEPLFILAESGSVEHGVLPLSGNSSIETIKGASDDGGGAFIQTASSVGNIDTTSGSHSDGSDHKTLPSLHCCYEWTEDWRWLVCIWTDSRGELLDSNIFPFGGISSRQDTKGLQCLFGQVLQQGCQILQACCSADSGVVKPRDFVITRIGSFYELEYFEWQKAIYSVGGSEMKKWTLQLRRPLSDGMPAGSNGTSLQSQDMSLIQERSLASSANPLYGGHSKTSGFMKAGLGQPAARKQLMGGLSLVDNSRGLLQWVQSISFVTISVDHTLHLIHQADSLSPGGTQSSGITGSSTYLEGFTPVKSLGSTSASYMLIPSPCMRFLPAKPLQLPTCLTSESPPLAHLLHSKGSAVPLSTGFVVSKAVPSMRKESRSCMKEEWPSVLSISLVDYYGGSSLGSVMKQTGCGLRSEARDLKTETQLILESVAAELHALSWMTVSPGYLDRRTALPFHCDMVLRLRRLLHFAEKELSQQSDNSQV